ncbi:hypothetical protein PENSPDRAFT_752671 [Peniophora sp. CONT]|nr:hypothetical protein PENSPDRAFT_752671 [Peniophora sp. CONT]
MWERTDESSMETLAQARWLDAFQALDASLPRLRPTDADVAQLRVRLDAEEAGIRLLLSAVNERRNELALPSMLPPEVLAHVFSYLITLDSTDLLMKNDPYRRRTFGCVSVTHVCRRWRSIATNQPSLWTHISPHMGRPWEVFLERAKGYPLAVKGILGGVGISTSERIRSILDRQRQLQELSITCIRHPDLEEIVAGLTGPLPLLQTLSLYASTASIHDTRPQLHSDLLSHFAPELRRLDLTSIAFPWGCGSANLTYFHYTHVGRRLTMPPLLHTFDEVISSLKAMPALKSLKLDNALPEHNPEHSDSRDVRLPRLEDLRLMECNDSCWYLWSRLDIPPSASIHIAQDSTLWTSAECEIASNLATHLHAALAPRFTVLSSQAVGDDSGTLTFRLSEARRPEAAESVERDIVRQWQSPSVFLSVCVEDQALLADQLLYEVPLVDLCDLELPGAVASAGGGPASQDFYRRFVTARQVTTLRLHGHRSEDVLAALLPEASFSSSQSNNHDGNAPSFDGVVLFPLLDRLTCTGVDFTEWADLAGSSAHSVLDQVLKHRSKVLGRPFSQLEITACAPVSTKWLNRWRERVTNLVWDGEGDDYGRSESETSDGDGEEGEESGDEEDEDDDDDEGLQ